jgi:phage N-6-adenine-methyltransferase
MSGATIADLARWRREADEATAIVRARHRQMPTQKPGKSFQAYETPLEFIDAVKKRFGIKHFAYDLAASAANTKATLYFDEAVDSLKQDWSKLRGDLWLNPPYAHIAPWAEKCAASAINGSRRRIFLLVPAAVGSNWFAQHVDGKALVLLLNGRICFDGKAPYPKDCILAVYGAKPGYEVWRW